MLEFLAVIEKHLLTIRRLIAGSASITDSQLRATPIDVNIVSGTVTIGSELEIMNDAGNPIPVDGTVAATQSGNWDVTSITNPVTVNVGLTDAELRATPIPVSVTGMGDATAANQTTIIGHLDGVEALLTTIDGDTSTLAGIDYATETTLAAINNHVQDEVALQTIFTNTLQNLYDETTAQSIVLGDIKTSVQTLDNAISGNEMQVDIVSMPSVTIATLPNEGQQLMADSISVTIASDQSAIPISGTITVNEPVSIDDNGGSITVDGIVELGAVSLAALESINVTVTSIGEVEITNDAGNPVPISDGGGSLTVDGTVGVNNFPATYPVTDNGGSLTIDAVSLPLPTGASTEATLATVETNTDYGTVTGGGTEASALRVTIASDSTGVLSIDDNGGSITIDGSITANAGSNLNTSALALETTLQSVKTAVEIIDNAISGNEMQVDVLTLPTISPDLASINFDAGGRQRISQLYTLGDYKILNADRTLLIETAGTGTGNFTNNTYTMTVTDGQYLIRQSKRYHPYLSGKSQLIELTFDNFDIQANVIKRIGYFSSNAVAPYASTFDGIYLENDGTDIRFRITNAGTTVVNVTQANWNVNTLGGHDWSKFNVILIDFLWLGGAVVRLYVKTSTGFQLCHVYTHAGAADGTMTLSPNQPIRYEIRGNGAGGTMTYVCAQVSTEGSIDESGSIIGLSHSSTGIALSAIGTIYPLIGVRKKSTHRDVALGVLEYKLLTASNSDQLKLFLLLNPRLSAPLTYSAGTGALEYAFGNGTITVSSVGTPLNVGFSTQISTMETQSLRSNFLTWLGSTLDNTMDQIILAGMPITATITTHSALTLKEL